MNERAQKSGRELGKRIPLHAVGYLPQQFYILVDGSLFIREGIQQGEPKALLAGTQIDDLVSQKETVVILIHGCPFQFAVGNVIEQSPAQGMG